MSNKDTEIYADALKRQEKENQVNSTNKTTQELTWKRDNTRDRSSDKSRQQPRDMSREKSRKHLHDSSREIPSDLPTRDDIQEFSFRLRDTLKVKVQAEVPHEWQTELDEVARELNVKKLELYRFIYGKFLGKVREKTKS